MFDVLSFFLSVENISDIFYAIFFLLTGYLYMRISTVVVEDKLEVERVKRCCCRRYPCCFVVGIGVVIVFVNINFLLV